MGNLQEERWSSSAAITAIVGTWTCFSSRTYNVTGKWALPTDLHSLDKWPDLVYCLTLQLLALGPQIASSLSWRWGQKVQYESSSARIFCLIWGSNLATFPATILLLPPGHGSGLNSSHISPPIHPALEACPLSLLALAALSGQRPLFLGTSVGLDNGLKFWAPCDCSSCLWALETLYLHLEGSHPGLNIP